MLIGCHCQTLLPNLYIACCLERTPTYKHDGPQVLNLDLTLSIVFGTISAGAFAAAVWCFRKALKVSGRPDGDLKMFVWAMGTMIGLIVSGMSAAYILLPIIFHQSE